MSTVNTKRLIRSGVQHFFRNIWVSIAATSMVTITLFIISVMIIIYVLATLTIQNSTDKVGVVTAYFNNTATDKEIGNLIAEVEAMPNVKAVIYTTKGQAKALFQQRHQNEPVLLDSLNEFTDAEGLIPASIAVRADNLSDYPQIYDTLRSERYAPYFASIRDNQKVIDKLHGIIDFITKFGLLLAAIFMLVTIMVTFNTIRLTIYNRREEVEIMRLVGATNWYIRWPFIIEGILYALFATFITSLVTLGLLFLLSGRIQQFLSIGSLGPSFFQMLFFQIFFTNLLASVGLTIIASSIAIRRYLRI